MCDPAREGVTPGEQRKEHEMGLISWLIFGALAGWVASMLYGNKDSQGWIGNIAVGLVGAVIGGFIGNLLFDVDMTKWSIGGFATAVVGAVIFLFVLRKLGR